MGEKTTMRVLALKVLAWIVVVLAGLFALAVFFDGVNHRIDTGRQLDALLSILALCLCISGIVVLATWGRRSLPTIGAIVGIVFLAGGILAWAEHQSASRNRELVEWYCGYGSDSAAQLAGCIGNTNAAVVNDLNTNAANFARGDGGCNLGSGPYCRGALRARDAQQAFGP